MARTHTVIVVDWRKQEVYCNDPQTELVYAGGPGEPTIEHCGCCEHEHLSTFYGDCRDDDARLTEALC